MSYSSKIIEDAVKVFSKLPGIGKKSALRLVLHLIKQENSVYDEFNKVINRLKNDLKQCRKCYNVSDEEVCAICQHPHRNNKVICVVESIRDVMAIEETGHYNGVYHVLGGVISPIEGIGIDQLKIKELSGRIQKNDIDEVILAISPTIEGDTTIFYLAKQMAEFNIKLSVLSRGLAFGGELEYTDGLTLGRSIVARIPYKEEAEI